MECQRVIVFGPLIVTELSQISIPHFWESLIVFRAICPLMNRGKDFRDLTPSQSFAKDSSCCASALSGDNALRGSHGIFWTMAGNGLGLDNYAGLL